MMPNPIRKETEIIDIGQTRRDLDSGPDGKPTRRGAALAGVSRRLPTSGSGSDSSSNREGLGLKALRLASRNAFRRSVAFDRDGGSSA